MNPTSTGLFAATRATWATVLGTRPDCAGPPGTHSGWRILAIRLARHQAWLVLEFDSTPAATIRVRVGGVYVKHDQLLLVRHAKQGRSYWLLPGGGVEPGESMAKSLEREALEECAIHTQTEQLLFVSEAIPPSRNRHYINLTFRGSILDGSPRLNETGSNIVEVTWVSRENLGTLTLYPDFVRPLTAAWDASFLTPPQFLGNLWRD